MKTLCELFFDNIDSRPDRVAVHHQGRDTTYAALASQADSFASWLVKAGVSAGDRVALLLPNSVEYVACYLGILQAGGVAVPLNPETTASELVHALGDCGPTVLVVGEKAAGPLAECAGRLTSVRAAAHSLKSPREPFPRHWRAGVLTSILDAGEPARRRLPGLDEFAQIIYTSGTTGPPKGVTLSHRNLAANCRSILAYLELTPDDSVFVTLPFFYSYGNSLLFTHLAAGGRLVLASNFVFWKQALDLMQQQRASGFSGVPSSYAMLLHKSDFGRRTFPHLRYMTCAGGGLAPAVVERLQSLLPDVRLFLMYGQTEATARLSTLRPEEIGSKLGSIGRGIPGVTLEVLDDAGQPVLPGEIGEIVARGENVMCGYWNDREATAKVLRPEGLRTGDLARVDSDGYLYIAGRSTDIIKSGAHRINPQEIEQEILRLDGVAEAAVVGMPDEIWGETPVAFIVGSATETVPSAEAVLDHCRRVLPRYKSVRKVHFVDTLPRTSSGKVQRNVLRNTFLQPAAADSAVRAE